MRNSSTNKKIILVTLTSLQSLKYRQSLGDKKVFQDHVASHPVSYSSYFLKLHTFFHCRKCVNSFTNKKIIKYHFNFFLMSEVYREFRK